LVEWTNGICKGQLLLLFLIQYESIFKPKPYNNFKHDLYIISLKEQIISLTDAQQAYLKSCIGEYVLVSDDIVRISAGNGWYDYDVPGCEQPHVRNPETKKFRDDRPKFVYACSKFIEGLNKHREAEDRKQFYGDEGQFRSPIYVYIISAEVAKLVRFQKLGMAYTERQKYFGKTPLPVKVDSCYEIRFNRDGIENSTFTRVL
jgi:hypothetical protein